MQAIKRRISSLEFIVQGMDADIADLGETMEALGNFCADQARKLHDLEAAFRARVGGILHRWGNRPVLNIPQPPPPSPVPEPVPFGPGAGAEPEVLPPPSGQEHEERQRRHMLAFLRSGRPLPSDFFTGRSNF